jgi:hypothetical protein
MQKQFHVFSSETLWPAEDTKFTMPPLKIYACYEPSCLITTAAKQVGYIIASGSEHK